MNNSTNNNSKEYMEDTEVEELVFSEAKNIRNFKGSFVNLFHTAFLLPLSTPYSLSSVMVRK